MIVRLTFKLMLPLPPEDQLPGNYTNIEWHAMRPSHICYAVELQMIIIPSTSSYLVWITEVE